MNKDKIKVYILEHLLVVILFFALFASNIINRVVLSMIMLAYMLLVIFALKKRKIMSINKRQVTIMLSILAIIYITALYLMGLYFGYAQATVKFGWWSFLRYVLPITSLIVTSEIIRYVFLSQTVKWSKFLTFISMVLIDLMIHVTIFNISTVDDLLSIVGFVLFASFSCNMLYNYISERYGFEAVIIYRMFTTLYTYIIPIVPDIYLFFQSFLRMLYPYIIYLTLEATYSKVNFAVPRKDKRKSVINTSVLIILATLIIMLVSCRFKYGVLVIGSGSMTGTINKGDAIIFEAYTEKQKVEKGHVIIFEKDNYKIVHRVIDIRNVNGEIRYFTKGDANSRVDEGYVTAKQIKGITKFKIQYIGYPTIWVRDIFS